MIRCLAIAVLVTGVFLPVIAAAEQPFPAVPVDYSMAVHGLPEDNPAKLLPLHSPARMQLLPLPPRRVFSTLPSVVHASTPGLKAPSAISTLPGEMSEDQAKQLLSIFEANE